MKEKEAEKKIGLKYEKEEKGKFEKNSFFEDESRLKDTEGTERSPRRSKKDIFPSRNPCGK